MHAEINHQDRNQECKPQAHEQDQGSEVQDWDQDYKNSISRPRL